MTVFNPAGGVAASGTANTHNLAGALGSNARQIAFTNTHATGILRITFSENGTDYSASAFNVNALPTVQLFNVNLASVKVDASVSGTTYSLAAWRD